MNAARAGGTLRLRWAFTGILIAATGWIGGCTKPQAYLDVLQEQRAAWKEMTEILAKVHDEKSMVEAKSALEERRERFEQIARKMKALPEPSAEVRQRMENESYVTQRALKRLQEEVGRVRALPGGEKFFEQFASNQQSLFQAVQP